jgi:single-strand DNA-binding protein
MISLNKAMLIGNATKDPELRYTPSGQAVCNFSIATNRRFKNAQGDLQEETQYHDLVAWGKLAELIVAMVKKGNKLYAEGRLQTRQWDAPDGSKRSRTEVVMEQFVPLAPKGGNMTEPTEVNDIKPVSKPKENKQNEETSQVSPEDEEINLDDIPF